MLSVAEPTSLRLGVRFIFGRSESRSRSVKLGKDRGVASEVLMFFGVLTL
jgi:hypothetical protein